MIKAIPRIFLQLAFGVLLPASLVTVAVAQTPYFTPGNLVVAVGGCGVHGSTCTTPPTGGTGSGGTYGDDQGSPWTLFQYAPSGASSATYVNSLQLPQNLSGANYPVSNDYGSLSEGTLQLSGDSRYLTIMGYGLNAAAFNVNYLNYCPGSTGAGNACVPENGNPAMAQTGSLLGQTYSGNVAVPRVAALIDANGNVNSSTVLFNIFNQNDARSAYTANGSTVYVSGQGCKTWDPSDFLCDGGNYDNTMGVYLTPEGATNNAPTAITGPDGGPPSCTGSGCTQSDDTRMVQIYNGTLYVSQDTHPGSSSGYNRSYIGALGTPPSTSVFTCTGVGAGCPTGDGPYGAAVLAGLGNTGGTGKYTMNTAGSGNTSNGNSFNSSTGNTAVNLSPQGFYFASSTVLYVADTGFPKNNSNGPNTTCTTDGGKSSATVGDGGLQKWILNPVVTAAITSGSKTVTGPLSGTFTQGQVGLPISGTGIPAGTTLTAVSGAGASATMSASATATNSSDSVTVSGWSLAYTLYNGLNLVLNTDCNPSNPTTQGSISTTGLYGVTGVVNGGVATLYVTSNPNNDLVQTYLYGITDTLATKSMTSPGTAFTLLDTAPSGSVFRGVSFVPTIPSGNVEVTSTASSVAAGLTVTTAGSGCSPSTLITPLTLAWTPGSSCTLSVASPQAQSGQQFVFSQWQDGTTGMTDTVTAPTTTATYTAAFTTEPSAIYSPAPSSTLSGASATFQWGGYPGATAFWLDVGTSSQANYYYSSGSLSNTTFSQAVSSLPTDGSTLYVTWYYLLNGTWMPNTYTYTAAGASGGSGGAAMMTSPNPGSTLSGSSATFSWSAATDNPQAYWLDIGTATQANYYYSSGNMPTSITSETVNSLPTDGSTLYVTLYTETGGTYVSNKYTYQALNPSSALAALTSPSPNNSAPPALPGSSVSFVWSPVMGAYAYYLDVGTSNSLNYYYSQNQGPGTSVMVSGLPTDGSPVVVTLYTQFNAGGQFYPNTFNFTAYNPGSQIAVMASPIPGSTLPGSSVPFSWSAVSGALAYYLDVGKPNSVNYYYSQNQGPSTSVTVNGLPTDGSPVVVTLYTQFTTNGQWYSNTYNYTAQ